MVARRLAGPLAPPPLAAAEPTPPPALDARTTAVPTLRLGTRVAPGARAVVACAAAWRACLALARAPWRRVARALTKEGRLAPRLLLPPLRLTARPMSASDESDESLSSAHQQRTASAAHCNATERGQAARRLPQAPPPSPGTHTVNTHSPYSTDHAPGKKSVMHCTGVYLRTRASNTAPSARPTREVQAPSTPNALRFSRTTTTSLWSHGAVPALSPSTVTEHALATACMRVCARARGRTRTATFSLVQ